MQKRVIIILLFCFCKNILSFSAARTVDPLTLALEQILSDITFEIVPCPTYPNIGPTCSNFYDAPNQYGSYNPNICGNPYDQYWQYGMEYGPNICTSPCVQYGMYGWEYGPNICSSPMPYDQCGMYGWEYGPNICNSPMPYDQCAFDTYPAYSCYRDMKNPCNVYEDSSYYICFDNCGCGCNKQSSPYIYFPEVEYPMTAMDVGPYFYGSCWCS